MAGAGLRAPLADAYGTLADVAESLGDTAQWLPTGCAGWSVHDLLLHLRADCVRALITFHTPASRPPDCDAVTYWRAWGSDAETDDLILRHTRTEASLYSWPVVRGRYVEAARAAVRAADDLVRDAVVETQGHALPVGDFVSTLVVEATLHHLDLVRDLPGAAGPGAAGLTETRRVTEALLGRDLAGWPDERVALVATGRAEPTRQERADLGDARVPVFT